MKKAFLGLLSLLLLFCVVSCALLPQPADKVFAVKEMSLTLDESFEALDTNGQAASLVSERHGYAVTVRKESFSLFEENDEGEPMSLEAYAQRAITENKIGDNVTVTTQDGILCYVYEKEVNGASFTYLATLHLAHEAYWTVQFACKSAKFEDAKSAFLAYAKTVTFISAETAP